MTKTARAAVYDAPNTPFVIREYGLPPLSGPASMREFDAVLCLAVQPGA